jgi:heparosan-N-sulfate-glucuronate 5-epimerase
LTPTVAKRSYAGFFSSDRTFFLPVGQHVESDKVRGYPIDMRVKASTARRPVFPSGDGLYIGFIQFGLGCYEQFLDAGREEWLDAALAVGRRLIELQDTDGSWWHTDAFPHTFELAPPWSSALPQGAGASLLVRLHLETGEPEFAAAARLALGPMRTPVEERGLRGQLEGMPWPEEYPTAPPAHVLNGAMFALWGMRDVAIGLDDAEAGRDFDLGIDALVKNLPRYDTGYWSLYSLFPHPVSNVASSFYHSLHVSQLEVMNRFAPRPEFEATRQRWAEYGSSQSCRRRAFASKAMFRLLVPRNRLLAHRVPWTRNGRGSAH